ncbi:ABC transporter ATP-binding protein [Chitinilyticum piscinae]|uniref:ABC transporter ATP-binding protein n=1 Tax=Chitinilyticum piscinae TaxID=2866724 RepID=A0A8J7KH17_9NEIS|nr:ABC transporter ATP-binding protein [Chitinilyticum piscinae]MBE9610989.1 ABC transporter ATP-binding protein [Chitinilyticum piscinae]
MTLACRNLALSRGGRQLLESLNWQLAAGECWLILGENGSGKSTLLATLAGWLKPEAGEVSLAGVPLAQLPRRQRAQELAWLVQQDEQPFPQTALERVLSGRQPWLQGWQWESPADVQLARQQLARLDLAMLEARDLGSLSGGERRRVALAAALAQQTPWLLLDEPLSQLDLRHQQQALAVLREECRQGRGLVMVTHDPNHAWAFATHALLLHGDGRWQAGPCGEVLTEAALSALYHHPVRLLRDGGRACFVPG